jgi:hypothetical protein
MDVPIENCVSAKIYKKSPLKKATWFVLIVALYCVTIPYAYFTVGNPREAAILKAQRLEDEKWMESGTMDSDTDGDDNFDSGLSTTMQDFAASVNGVSGTRASRDDAEEAMIDEFGDVQASSRASASLLSNPNEQIKTGIMANMFATQEDKERRKAAKEEAEKIVRTFRDAAGEELILVRLLFVTYTFPRTTLFSFLDSSPPSAPPSASPSLIANSYYSYYSYYAYYACYACALLN